MKNLISTKRPKVVCVNFSPLRDSNNLEDNCDKVALWKNPPPANALDVAKLLKQLNCEVIVTGFVPKGYSKKISKKLQLSTEFIEIENQPKLKSSEFTYDTLHKWVISDDEKARFIEFVISLSESIHAILFTGVFPDNFTLQDFKILVNKRLRNPMSSTFSDINDKVSKITYSNLNFSVESYSDYAYSPHLFWNAGKGFEFILKDKKEAVTLYPFQKQAPHHTRTAVFTAAIFAEAFNRLHYQAFNERYNKVFKEQYNAWKNAECEQQQDEVLNEYTVKFLGIPPVKNKMTIKEITNLMSLLMIHIVSSGLLSLPSSRDIDQYQNYFNIESS